MVYLLLAGAINGVNRIFSLTTLDGQLAVPSSTYLEVWKNGSALIQGTDYALNSFVVTLVLAPQPAVGTNPTDWLLGVTDSATACPPPARRRCARPNGGRSVGSPPAPFRPRTAVLPSALRPARRRTRITSRWESPACC